MPDGLTTDLLQRSVTAADQSEYKGGGVVNFLIPWFMMGAANLPLPADLPPYWTLNLGIARYWSRDMVLRSTILHEDYWSSAVSRACSKQAAKSFEVKGRGADRWQDMLLDWGGDGYVPSMQKGMLDFLTTDNGCFWEVVRATGAYGSRVLGLIHLDSLRCIRTADPQRPVVFVDLLGKYHTLRDYQVLALRDTPDSSAAGLGIGHCAAERAYHAIYELSAVRQYVREKVTGTGANVLDFISGLSSQQIAGIVDTARLEQQARGMSYFQGHVITGLLAQVEPKLLQIKLRDLPDGFVAKEVLEDDLLIYANAIGLDPQEVSPKLLGPRSMGVSAQSNVLEEKQHLAGPLPIFDKQMTHMLNTKVVSPSVTFAWNERDLRQEQIEAAVALVHEQTRNSMILNGQITAQMGLQKAVIDNDWPRDLAPVAATSQDTPLSDEEKPIVAEDNPVIDQPDNTIAAQQGPQVTKRPIPGQGLSKGSTAAIKELSDEIRLARLTLQRQNGNGNQPSV